MTIFYATYVLEIAETQGAMVINKPQSLRDANEKFFATHFPDCMPETLVASATHNLKEFVHEYKKVVVKPLDSMGGCGIRILTAGQDRLDETLAEITDQENSMIMMQRYLPAIKQGDKRILLIDGEPAPYALSRIPLDNDFRGNLAAGATGIGAKLTEREREICWRIAPTLKAKGLFFVGIDVIGEHLTEINVTSPTMYTRN